MYTYIYIYIYTYTYIYIYIYCQTSSVTHQYFHILSINSRISKYIYSISISSPMYRCMTGLLFPVSRFWPAIPSTLCVKSGIPCSCGRTKRHRARDSIGVLTHHFNPLVICYITHGQITIYFVNFPMKHGDFP